MKKISDLNKIKIESKKDIIQRNNFNLPNDNIIEKIKIENQRDYLLQRALYDFEIFLSSKKVTVIEINNSDLRKIIIIHKRYLKFLSVLKFSQSILSSLVFLVFVADFVFEVNSSRINNGVNYAVSLLISLSFLGFMLTSIWSYTKYRKRKERVKLLKILFGKNTKIL